MSTRCALFYRVSGNDFVFVRFALVYSMFPSQPRCVEHDKSAGMRRTRASMSGTRMARGSGCSQAKQEEEEYECIRRSEGEGGGGKIWMEMKGKMKREKRGCVLVAEK